jgi:hypothetical protein
MIPLAYTTTVAMARRAFDLSGDPRIDHDPLYESIFPFSNLVIFSVLVVAALAYRRTPEIHKRLMHDRTWPKSVCGSGRSCWVITNTTLFPGTRLSCASSNFACAGYGGVFWSAAVSAHRCVGNVSPQS